MCYVNYGAVDNAPVVGPFRGGSFLAPDYIGGGGNMVSHTELYAYTVMLIAFATLVLKIAKKK